MRPLLALAVTVSLAALGGCAWLGPDDPPLAFQRVYSRLELPASLTAPVPHPPVPPRPVVESAVIARDEAYAAALDLCNFQKSEIERLAAGGRLPTEDQRAK